jgi:hypothetical protein
MKQFVKQNRIVGVDNYGQPLTTYIGIMTVDVSVSLLSKVLNELDPRYIKATHIGLTLDKSLVQDMKLNGTDETYIIKIVNNDGRYAQLTLELI